MFLEKNLNALAKRYPQYVAPIREAKISGKYMSQPSARKDRMKNLVNRQLGIPYYNNIDPFKGIEQEFKEQNIRLPQIGVFIGFGLGYHLYVYKNTFGNKVELQIVFEDDWELIKLAFTEGDHTQIILQPRIIFCFGSNPQLFYPELFNILQQGHAKMFLKALTFIQCGPSFSASKNFYTACIKILKDAAAGIFNLYGNDPQDSMIGIQHTFYNIEEIIKNPGIKDLKGVFKGKPGVVVATGPSLLKNIHLLDEVKDRAVIVAADASMKIMKDHGLKPHMVTCLERVLETAGLFNNLEKEDFEDVYFAACPVVHPQSYKNFKGERIIVYRHFATFKWLNIDRGILEIGPSSANMAFKVLEYLGCNPIILIGQDLAYAGEQTHPEGATYGTYQKQGGGANMAGFMVPGNYEPLVRTIQVWQLFKRYYEKDIAAYSGRVINATEGGAKINGAEVMTFREAIDSFMGKPLDILGTIRKKLNPPFPAQQEKDRQAITKKVREAIEYCESVINRLQEGLKDCRDFADNIYSPWKNGDISKESAADARFQEIDAYLKIFGEEKFFLIIMHYVQSYFIKSMNDINALKAGSNPSLDQTMAVVVKLGDLYGTIGALTDNMLKELNILLELLTEPDKAGVK